MASDFSLPISAFRNFFISYHKTSHSSIAHYGAFIYVNMNKMGANQIHIYQMVVGRKSSANVLK